MVARRGGVKLRAITVLEGDMEQHGGLMAEQHHGADPREAGQVRKRMGAEAALKAAVAEFAGDLETDIDVLAEDPGRRADQRLPPRRPARDGLPRPRGQEVGRARQRVPPGRGRRRLPGADPPARRERDDPAARRQRPVARTRVTVARGVRVTRARRARRRRPRGAARAPALGPRRLEPARPAARTRWRSSSARASTRIPELIAIRYGRMLRSPFAFYRGGAAIMAADLAAVPSTGITASCAATRT